MSVSCVPPGNASPYQNGIDPAVNALSAKVADRHAVVSGVEASAVPLKYLHAALVLKSTTAFAESPESSQTTPSKARRKRGKRHDFITEHLLQQGDGAHITLAMWKLNAKGQGNGCGADAVGWRSIR
jgi:hypothetical protein